MEKVGLGRKQPLHYDLGPQGYSSCVCVCVCVTGFAIVFGTTLYSARAYLYHWTLTSTTCNCSPEGRHDPI